jgi:hypothetical protein
MKALFKIIFFPVVILFKICIAILYFMRGVIFGIISIPLACLGIDPFHHHHY